MLEATCVGRARNVRRVRNDPVQSALRLSEVRLLRLLRLLQHETGDDERT